MKTVFLTNTLALLAGCGDALVPVSRSPNLLHSRSNRFQADVVPRKILRSDYNHGPLGSDYRVTVTHSHNTHSFVSLDDLDQHGVTMACEHRESVHNERSTAMTLSFASTQDFALAEAVWGDGTTLILSSTHPSCDEDAATLFLSPKRLRYDHSRAAIHVEAISTTLSDHNVHGGTIQVEFGPPVGGTASLAKRQSLEPLEYNKTVDFDQPFTQPEAPLFSSPGLNVTCVDCSVTGQVMPSFSVTIANDSSTIQSGVDDGQPNNLIQNASLSATVTKPITANMTLRIDSIDQFDFHCAIPPPVGGCSASVSIADSSQGGLGSTLLDLSSFVISGVNFTPTYSLGLRFDLQVTAQTSMTLPFSAYIPQDGYASMGLFSAEDNAFSPTFDLGQPTLSGKAVNACATVAYGPQASLTLASGSKPLLSIGGEVDVPKVKMCAHQTNNVDMDCNTGGPISNAIEVDTQVSAGVTLNASALNIVHENSPDFLEPTLLNLRNCFPYEAPTGNATLSLPSNGSSTLSYPSTSSGVIGPGAMTTPANPYNTPSSITFTPTSSPQAVYTGLATSLTKSSSGLGIAFMAVCAALVI